MVGRDLIVLEEDGKKVIECHRVIREDRQGNDDCHDSLGENIIARLLPDSLRRGGGILNIPSPHGTIVFVAKVNSGALHRIGGLDQGRVLGKERIVGKQNAGLHIGMCLLEEKITKHDAHKKHAGADKVGQ